MRLYAYMAILCNDMVIVPSIYLIYANQNIIDTFHTKHGAATLNKRVRFHFIFFVQFSICIGIFLFYHHHNHVCKYNTGTLIRLISIDTEQEWVWSHIMEYVSHYTDVIMSEVASQITSLTIVYSIVYSDVDLRKHQSSASLAFVRGIHRWPVNSPHKWPVTRKKFPFDDVIMVIQG